ncbi:MAG: preprotein translocase subunit SecE [Saprospiraceae bacterium]|jgi:preprotein translocase subunit SecE|nr:preprotein translocase subunit SecE [Saprospiraceae bacterium]MBP9209975.1 preprotein translocase subunit SecE [Saprospiraceae bacterium]
MDKFVLYVKESYQELMEKVSWPTWPNLVDSAKVVLISSVLLSVLLFAIDFVVNQVLTFVYSL